MDKSEETVGTTPKKNWFKRHPILTGLGALIVLFIIIGAATSGGTKSSSTNHDTAKSDGQKQEQQATPEPTKIDVKTLGDAFNANQVAAEKEWKGKSVEFSAEISNITDGTISFQKVDSKEFSMTQISCRLKDKDQALNVQNGQTITVQGVVGEQTFGVIELKECTVVK